MKGFIKTALVLAGLMGLSVQVANAQYFTIGEYEGVWQGSRFKNEVAVLYTFDTSMRVSMYIAGDGTEYASYTIDGPEVVIYGASNYIEKWSIVNDYTIYNRSENLYLVNELAMKQSFGRNRFNQDPTANLAAARSLKNRVSTDYDYIISLYNKSADKITLTAYDESLYENAFYNKTLAEMDVNGIDTYLANFSDYNAEHATALKDAYAKRLADKIGRDMSNVDYEKPRVYATTPEMKAYVEAQIKKNVDTREARGKEMLSEARTYPLDAYYSQKVMSLIEDAEKFTTLSEDDRLLYRDAETAHNKAIAAEEISSVYISIYNQERIDYILAKYSKLYPDLTDPVSDNFAKCIANSFWRGSEDSDKAAALSYSMSKDTDKYIKSMWLQKIQKAHPPVQHDRRLTVKAK